jgi:asparagine synthase (glutamine-hydrolysing)
MCGIAGYVGWDRSHDASDADLRRMCGAIVHRGPDDEGRLSVPGAALGMRRLSVIDVAHGQQPMANEDGTVHVVFNGEIYNHRALRAALVGRGHRLLTHSDTETLVHLYEDHGAAMAEPLRGMFGLAIYDATRRRLLLARDRLGQKPLYYWEHDGGLAFASEVRSLRALAHFPAEVDPAAVAAYLRLGYVPDPLCIYRGVRKLPPGHVLVWEAGGGPARVERYWTPVRDEADVGEQDAVAELRRLFADAVGSHLESEVPLGAFLSGGVDSSAVVAEMARQMDRPVKTFSIGFDVDAYNEAPHAAEVARALGTEHTELIVRPDADALVERVVLGFDEPFADSSALPTYLVAELARRHVTVALSGDGGDELFGGYTRYAELLGRRELPAWARPRVRPGGPGAAARRLRPQPPARPGPHARPAVRHHRGPAAVGRRGRRGPRRAAGRGRPGRRAPARRVRVGPLARLPHAAHPRRPPELPAGRHPHEGRPHDDGRLARGARAAPGPPAGGVRRVAARPPQAAGRHGEVDLPPGDGGAGAGVGVREAEAGVRRPPGRVVPGPAALPPGRPPLRGRAHARLRRPRRGGAPARRAPERAARPFGRAVAPARARPLAQERRARPGPGDRATGDGAPVALAGARRVA